MGGELTGAAAPSYEVVAATTGRLVDAADVMLLAYVQDPMTHVLIPPGARRREERLHLLYQSELHTVGLDRIDLVVDRRTDQVMGVGVWAGPPRPRGAGPSPADVARWAVSSVAAQGHTGALAGRRQDRWVAKVRPPEPHWYLLDLAVDPVAQRRGIGSMLLRHRLRQVDDEAKRAFLCATTPSAQRLYARHGFEPVLRLPRTAGGATAMVRRPVIRI